MYGLVGLLIGFRGGEAAAYLTVAGLDTLGREVKATGKFLLTLSNKQTVIPNATVNDWEGSLCTPEV